MVSNHTHGQVVVRARDGMGRELITATLRPNDRQCFRWPFIHEVGYLIASGGGADTLMTRSFEPWTADGWEWSGQFEPVANPRVCR